MHIDRFRIIFLFLLCASFYLSAEEPLKLSFQQLTEFDQDAINKVVRIRGFLYPEKESHWILASEPNLKTCCVGSQGKIKQQIIVTGDISNKAYDTVVEVAGVFSIVPKYDSLGNLVQLYHLDDAEVIENSSNGLLILSLITCCVVVGYFLRMKFGVR